MRGISSSDSSSEEDSDGEASASDDEVTSEEAGVDELGGFVGADLEVVMDG